jgi:superfamily I DNA and RNA helicase
LIEQIAFAFGLAYKIKKINENLFFQLTENEKIKSNQNDLLQRELQSKEMELMKITKKAEEERVSKIKTEFENESRNQTVEPGR